MRHLVKEQMLQAKRVLRIGGGTLGLELGHLVGMSVHLGDRVLLVCMSVVALGVFSIYNSSLREM